MAQYYDAANTYVELFNEPGVTTVVYCKLFGDMVLDKVCTLRRRIPTTRNRLSCRGCIMNAAFLDRQPCWLQ